jgi:hypothetical protein
MQCKRRSPFEIYKDRAAKRIDIKRVGINKAFAPKLFCNDHDSEVFKPIETRIIDFNDYTSLLLFSYRTVCLELRQCYDNEIIAKECLQTLPSMMIERFGSRKGQILGKFIIDWHTEEINYENTLIAVLMEQKKGIELELNQTNYSYTFAQTSCTLLPIALSSVMTNAASQKPYLLQIIPYQGKTTVLLGFHESHKNDWIFQCINAWQSWPLEVIKREISKIIMFICVNWVMSPSLYTGMSENKRNILDQAFTDNALNLFSHEPIDFFSE